MGNYKMILAALCLLVIHPFLKGQDTITGTVNRVIDGDTYWITPQTINGKPIATDDNVLKIRLAGVDCPEIRGYSDADQPGGRMVSDSLRAMLKGKTVTVIKMTAVDEWGRIIGRVYLGSLDVTSYVLQRGYGWYLPTKGMSRAIRRQYKAEFEAARDERRGVFLRDRTPETPSHFRENHKIR